MKLSDSKKIDRFRSYASEKRPLLDRFLKSWLAQKESSCQAPRLGEAIAYSTFPGGKRFRPLLCLAVGESLGLAQEKVLPLALSLELIHCFSLVHDDLPCMDDDDERRGKKTTHIRYDEALALLAGDQMIFFAFQILLESRELSAKEKIACLEILSTLSGSEGMIAGQVLDMQAQESEKEPSWKEIRQIHELKTAALIRACVEMPCELVDLEKEVVEALFEFGELVGRAFQVVDDLLDLGTDPKEVSALSGASVEELEQLLLRDQARVEWLLSPLGETFEVLQDAYRMVVSRWKR